VQLPTFQAGVGAWPGHRRRDPPVVGEAVGGGCGLGVPDGLGLTDVGGWVGGGSVCAGGGGTTGGGVVGRGVTTAGGGTAGRLGRMPSRPAGRGATAGWLATGSPSASRDGAGVAVGAPLAAVVAGRGVGRPLLPVVGAGPATTSVELARPKPVAYNPTASSTSASPSAPQPITAHGLP
jgi:hypothetical protein